MKFESYDPQILEPIQIYGLLTNIVVPRPIALVSTVSSAGIANLAPFSYFNLGGSNPPSVVFSPGTLPKGAVKDSLANIRETGEFVINMLTVESAEKMNLTSVGFSADVDEWEVSGFTPLESELIKPARALESPAQLECKLFEIISHGDGPGAANYVIGEVLKIHVSEHWVDRIDKFSPISRLGGADYLDLESGNRFVLKRPEA